MRTPLNTLVVAAVALAVGMTACGKSDPAPAEAPKTEPKKAKESEAKDPKAAAKADPQKAAEAKDDKKAEPAKTEPAVAKVGGAVAKADPATPPATPPAAVGAAAQPFVYVGTPSLSALLTKVKEITKDANIPNAMLEDPEKAALEGLKAVMQLSDTSWLDTKSPIRLVVADPRKFNDDGAALVLPITDAAKMLAALPATANKDAAANGGHTAVMELRGDKVYIDTIPGHAVLAVNTGVFAATKAGIVGSLVKWTPTKPLELRLDLATINRDYANELKSARKMAKELYAQTMKSQGQEALADLAAGNVDMMFDFIASTKTLSVRLDAIKDHLLTSLAVEGAPESGVEKFREALKGKRSALVAAVAKGSWMALVGNVDTRNIEGLRKMQGVALRGYAAALGLDEAASKKIDAMADQMWKLSEGDVAMSFSNEGGFPLAMRYVASVTDATKMRSLYHQLTKMIVDAGVAQAKQGGLEAPFLKPGTSLTEIVKAIAPMATEAGLKVEVAAPAVGTVLMDVLRVEIDWAKFPMTKQDPEGAKIAKSMLGSKFQFVLAYSGKYMAMTFGPTAEKTAAKLAMGKFDEGDPSVAAKAAMNPLVFSLNFGRLVEAFQNVSPGLGDKKQAIADLAKTPPMTVTLSEENKAVVATIDWPISTIMQFANLMR